MNDTVTMTQLDGVAVITLNRPEKLNALNTELLSALEAHLFSVQTDRSVRVVVLTGSGPKAFAAGADISELHAQDGYSGRLYAEKGQRVLNLIERLGKPVIAAVNGFALGGGCELSMACHMRFAADTARFGQPEINLGIIPGFGGTQRLPRLVGTPKALELILSGDMLGASDALSIGLVNRVYSANELMDSTLAFARTLADKAPLALTACLEAVQIAGDTSLLEGLHVEASVFSRTCGTSDFKEGTRAFVEKRQAAFTGT
ncbi:MAG: enoyl-CoA hydratase-related protein [Candidatus Kapabacteria bacterium]|nr:enoyl-CoA hydratase-related protein [Candidatus Kapabacteria bacterium]